MTKQKAIKIIQSLIKFKEETIDSMNNLQFHDPRINLEKGLIGIAQAEQRLLKKALQELNQE